MSKLFLVLFSFQTLESCASLTTANSSTYDQFTTVVTTTGDPVNCSFKIADVSVKTKIETFIDDRKKLIFLHFRLPRFDTSEIESDGTIYKILDFVLTTQKHGNELLLMHPEFEVLSLGILMFGVEHVDIPLDEMLPYCLINITSKIFKEKLLDFTSNEFNLIETENQENNAKLCYMNVQNSNGYAHFSYNCCFRNISGDKICDELKSNMWMTVMVFAKVVAYVIAFLFIPYLIPTSWYTRRNSIVRCLVPNTYWVTFVDPTKEEPQHFEDHKSILNLAKSQQANILQSNERAANGIHINQIQLDNLEDEKTFQDELKKLQVEKRHVMSTQTFTIGTHDLKIVSASYVPTGILHYLYRQFVDCNIKNHDYLTDCCDDKCCGCLDPSCTWYNFLKRIMQGVFFLLLLSPWLLRVLFFYIVESKDRNRRGVFANHMNLSYPYVFDWNLTYTLMPDHTFFIFCYVSVFFLPFCKPLIKNIFQRSEDIEKKARNNLVKWIKMLLLPCRKLGCLGLIVGPAYLLPIIPCIICSYIVQSIPLVKISVTFIISLIKDLSNKAKDYDSKENKGKSTCLLLLWIMLVVILILILAASMILCLEVVVFFLSICIYVFIGIVLNASLVFTYVAFAGMLLFYTYYTLRNVKRKYENFSKTLFEYFVSVSQRHGFSKQIKNDAFLIILNEDSILEKLEYILQTDKLNTVSFDLTLCTKNPILFFDQHEKPFLNESTFFDICEMELEGAPGSVWKNYKKAFRSFIVIGLFLTCVTIIVLAFGQSHGVPDTYQAIATLCGGLIPFLVEHFFSKDDELLDLKRDDIFFKDQLCDVFHETRYPILEIIGSKVPVGMTIPQTDERCFSFTKLNESPNDKQGQTVDLFTKVKDKITCIKK